MAEGLNQRESARDQPGHILRSAHLPDAHYSTKMTRVSGRPLWIKALPASWRDLVVVPVHFDVTNEYEVIADRTLGLDENDQPCYCAYRYILTELRSDDDDEFYEELVYAEFVTGWRLRDERWLVFRKVIANYQPNAMQSCFSLSDSRPR